MQLVFKYQHVSCFPTVRRNAPSNLCQNQDFYHVKLEACARRVPFVCSTFWGNVLSFFWHGAAVGSQVHYSCVSFSVGTTFLCAFVVLSCYCTMCAVAQVYSYGIFSEVHVACSRNGICQGKCCLSGVHWITQMSIGS